MTDRLQPRIAPLDRDAWNDDVRTALQAAVPTEVAERFLSTGPDALRVPNAIATMLHHATLAGPFLEYNGILLRHPLLDNRLRELMVLRVAWRTRCAYEWLQHVRLSPRYAITEAEIAAIGTDPVTGHWSPLEADLLAATDQLVDGYAIDDEVWKRLAAALDEAQLLEAVFVVGTYTCLAMVFNAVGVDLDPELQTMAPPPFAATS